MTSMVSSPHRWRRYPSYKPSGVEWLGEVPEGWDVQRMKNLCEIISGQSPNEETYNSDEDGAILVNGPAEYSENDFGLTRQLKWTTDPKKWAPQSVLLFCLRGSTTGRLNITHTKLSIGRGVAALVAKDDQHFLNYLMVAMRDFVLGSANGSTFPSVTSENLGLYPICHPSIPEQTAIATFLDRETARIDALIAKKERQIELLQEKRATLISHAVTKGLDPNSSYKSSGLEWIEHIPKYWQKIKLSHITTEIGDGLHGTPDYVDESPYHFINGNNLSNGSIKITESARCVNADEFQKYIIKLDDSTLLMSINGTIGSVAYYQGELIILGKSAAYINCGKLISRKYLFYLFQSTQLLNYFMSHATGTTILNLSLETIRNLQVTLPPLKEQQEIVSFLDNESSQINVIIKKIQESIDKLLEYRSVLISAAVTGKIDVRQEAKA
ncbi:MAG: restriction endonuclease subunit S [Methanomicrobiales archaeon]|nr:restriction endonuclease subunit S [Methanomicrobiales archaeon]